VFVSNADTMKNTTPRHDFVYHANYSCKCDLVEKHAQFADHIGPVLLTCGV